VLLNIRSRYERMRCSRIKQHNRRSVVDEKHTNDNIQSFLCFLHNNMVDSPTSIVLLGSNRNRVGSMGKCRCRHNWLRRVSARVLAVVKYIYLPPTYLYFIQDVEDRCLLLTSFVDLPFQEHRMMEKHHMDQNPYIS
jgi:hypothetical protein